MKPGTVGNNLQQLTAIGRSEQQLQLQSHISGLHLTQTPLLIYTSMSTRLGKKVTAALSCGSKLQRYLGGCNTLSVNNGSVSEQLVTLTLKATIQKLAERVSFRSSSSERPFLNKERKSSTRAARCFGREAGWKPTYALRTRARVLLFLSGECA